MESLLERRVGGSTLLARLFVREPPNLSASKAECRDGRRARCDGGTSESGVGVDLNNEANGAPRRVDGLLKKLAFGLGSRKLGFDESFKSFRIGSRAHKLSTLCSASSSVSVCSVIVLDRDLVRQVVSAVESEPSASGRC